MSVRHEGQRGTCPPQSGANLPGLGFALGDNVELECNYSDGRWQLSSLTSDSAQLALG